MTECTVYVDSTEKLLAVVGYLADAGVWFEVFRNEHNKNAGWDFEVSVDPRNATVLRLAMETETLYGFVNYGVMIQDAYPIPGEDPHAESDWQNVLDHLQDWAGELGEIFHLRPHYLVPVSEAKVKAALRKLAEGRGWCGDCGRYTLPAADDDARCGECEILYYEKDPLATWLKSKA